MYLNNNPILGTEESYFVEIWHTNLLENQLNRYYNKRINFNLLVCLFFIPKFIKQIILINVVTKVKKSGMKK